MTDNDNKDPQITAEKELYYKRKEICIKKWVDSQNGAIRQDNFFAWVDGYDAAYNQLTAELKQLRADNEISESTQAALYKSLLIIQRKYEQLRAERAGLIAEIDKEIIKLEPRLYKTDSEIEILYKFKKLKSKLTDSAQITTDTEGK